MAKKTEKTSKTTQSTKGASKGAPASKATSSSTKGKAGAATKVAKKAPVKKGPKPAPKAQGPRHPKARVAAAHGGKEALAKSLAASLAIGDESASDVESRLKTASNAQLLHLAAVAEKVKAKWGSRDKLIAAIGAAEKKSKDQDFLTKLGSYSLPQLVDLAK
jgi:hypothetical protein